MADFDAGQFEVLDRTSIIMQSLEQNIGEHERLANEPEVRAKIIAAIGLLYEVYNWAGACLDTLPDGQVAPRVEPREDARVVAGSSPAPDRSDWPDVRVEQLRKGLHDIAYSEENEFSKEGVNLTVLIREAAQYVEFTLPDNCQVCKGAKGGVRGNENNIDGVVMCDYCSAERKT